MAQLGSIENVHELPKLGQEMTMLTRHERLFWRDDKVSPLAEPSPTRVLGEAFVHFHPEKLVTLTNSGFVNKPRIAQSRTQLKHIFLELGAIHRPFEAGILRSPL